MKRAFCQAVGLFGKNLFGFVGLICKAPFRFVRRLVSFAFTMTLLFFAILLAKYDPNLYESV